ncbi:M20 family metallopeptidase [Pandoraea sp. PE-S2R-1]|uniref:M20 family metallopeptidase n=1 Tax=Pandoraea sp. PE-S2R-1 TaxID=1986994 RepID=UPI0020160A86|nr:M20/M25/M40 family metallo-hydrolase [Pandoraea sp. PE-S2R-1]
MSMTQRHPPMSEAQHALFERACAQIDANRLKRLVADLVDIHSPTGAERPLAEFMRGHLAGMGLSASYQPITAQAGNVWGRLSGEGGGASLMLYAPLDTHLEANPADDVPWVGASMSRDMTVPASVRGDTVVGLGASNPKAMIAALTEAVNALVDAGARLPGDVLLACAGGGMPVVAPQRDHAGLSNGVMHLMTHGVTADFGLVLKPWDEVYYEHPGLCWFKVSVEGTLGYAGVPRGTPGFRSSILPAARLIEALEAWLPDYTAQHLSDQIEPQGWISGVRAGWPERPAFPSAVTEIYLDLRIGPQQTPAGMLAEFSVQMRDIMRRFPEIRARWEMIGSIPASRVDPDHWIVRSATRAWQHTHGGRPYPGAPRMSGQTDAAVMAKLGLPVVRLGFPWPGNAPQQTDCGEGLGGMGVVHVPDLIDPIKTVLYLIIDTCSRSRAEVGLT